MQKLYSNKIIILLILLSLLFSCSLKEKERRIINFTRSISIDGQMSLDWKLNPLYIGVELFQPSNISELKHEISNTMDQRFFSELKGYAESSFDKINLNSKDCNLLGKQLAHFYEEYFKFMKLNNPNNSEYHIYGMSWMITNWYKIKKIQRQNPICKIGYLSEELYLYGLFYFEAIEIKRDM